MQARINTYFSTDKAGVGRPTKDVVHMGSAVASGRIEHRKPNPFDTLPIEMNQRIAEALSDDRDLYSFMRTCRSTRDAVEGDRQSFWRRRFLATFEKPVSSKSNIEYKKMYLSRRLFNFHVVTFSSGSTRAEARCLTAIRDIINDSFSEAPAQASADPPYKSSNLVYLSKIIEACPSLLSSVFDPDLRNRPQHRSNGPIQPTPLLQMMQVLLAPHLLNPSSQLTPYGYQDSQRKAYLFKTIFKGYYGLKIDMEWMLHQLNFWRYHMLRAEELTLHQAYSDLDDSEYPRYWEKQPRNDDIPAIGRFWKGSYAFLHADEHALLRSGEYDNADIQDIFCGADSGGDFQDLELNLLEAGEETWPPVFEEHLMALSEPKRRVAKTPTPNEQSASTAAESDSSEARSFRFEGAGDDSTEAFQADGWLNTLPSQNGVPGWQRLTMMKYWGDDFGEIDYSSLWAYEGVVLPGGKIIVGRWWSPYPNEDNVVDSGPFILWCVDTPALLRQHEAREHARGSPGL